MQKQSTEKGFAILSISTIIIKCLSFIYVPFLRIILGGDGPYGVYSITYTIYAFIYVVANTGIPSAISKLVSEYAAVGDFRNANRVFKLSRSLLFALGLVMSLIMLLIAGPITAGIGSSDSKLSVMALCPAILFTSVSSAYRGYFQGHRNMKPTAISQVLEQILNLVFSLLFAYLFIGKGVGYGCAGATVGTTIGAFASGLYLVILYEKDKYNPYDTATGNAVHAFITSRNLLKRIVKFSIPITVCIGLINAGPLIDGANIISRLSAIGYNQKDALALYGMYSKYYPLLNMPISIISALAMTVLPAISAAVALHDYKLLKRKMNFAFRITFLIAIPSAFGFAALGQPIYQLLGYGKGYEIMVWGSFLVILSALVQIQTSILQGMAKHYAVTLYMALGIAFKFVANYIFVSIPSINIYGAIIGNAVGFGIPVVLNMIYIQKYLRAKIHLRPHIVKPLLSSICMTAVVLASYFICKYLFGFGISGYLLNAISSVIAIVCGILTYFYVLAYFGGITSEEYDMIPGRIKRFLPKI